MASVNTVRQPEWVQAQKNKYLSNQAAMKAESNEFLRAAASQGVALNTRKMSKGLNVEESIINGYVKAVRNNAINAGLSEEEANALAQKENAKQRKNRGLPPRVANIPGVSAGNARPIGKGGRKTRRVVKGKKHSGKKHTAKKHSSKKRATMKKHARK